MIRICDGVVEELDISGFQRSDFIMAILENRFTNVLFLVYESGKKIGTLQYADVISQDGELRDCVQTEKIYYNEQVFEKCRTFFANNPSHRFVPLFDKNDDICYMAFNDRRNYVQYDVFLGYLQQCLQKGMYYSFYDQFPGLGGFYLQDVNELSYMLYKVFKNHDIPYRLLGDQWCLLEEYEQEGINDIQIPDCARIMIPANGISQRTYDITDSDFYIREHVAQYYQFLYRNEEECYANLASELSRMLHEVGVGTLKIKFPLAEDISVKSEAQKTAIKNYISMERREASMGEANSEILKAIYGEKCFNDNKSGEVAKGRFHDIRWGVPIQAVIDEERPNAIYLISLCLSQQFTLLAEDTLIGQWQRKLDESHPNTYKVYGVAITLDRSYAMKEFIETIPFREGDKVIFAYYSLFQDDFSGYIDLKDAMNNHSDEIWFSNEPMHLTTLGSKKVAETVWEKFLAKEIKESNGKQIVKFASRLEEEKLEGETKYINQYRQFIKDGNNGAIVMNCNPYTLGHDYLIRFAAKEVDTLYVFVVEEDKSFFPFVDRFELVKQNCADIENVVVIPSGNMILSMSTMKSYFLKEQNKEEVVDATTDLGIFALGIAPEFHIEKRFVGEEPIDLVTRQYNEAMKEILPHYGIDLVEIPRKQAGDQVISASLVRRFLEEKNWDEIEKYVPEITLRYLKGRANTN